MIRLNVFMQVTEETRDQVLADAIALTENSRNEDGCVAYDIFTSATRPDVLMICETWRDAAALEAHKATEHFARYSGNMHALAQMKTEKFEF